MFKGVIIFTSSILLSAVAAADGNVNAVSFGCYADEIQPSGITKSIKSTGQSINDYEFEVDGMKTVIHASLISDHSATFYLPTAAILYIRKSSNNTETSNIQIDLAKNGMFVEATKLASGSIFRIVCSNRTK